MCAKYLEYETKLIHLQLMRSTPADAGKTKKEPRTQCYRSDHPRRCGENHVHGGYCRVYLGSPPQVRGKQKAAALDYLPIGITPADAGKTNRLYYTFIRQKKQHMTFSVILSVHHKY